MDLKCLRKRHFSFDVRVNFRAILRVIIAGGDSAYERVGDARRLS